MIASGRIQGSRTKHDEVLRPRKMSRYAGKNAFKLRALRTVDIGRLSCTKGLGNWNQNCRTSSVSGLEFAFLHALYRLNWRSRSIPSTSGSPSVLSWHGHEARGACYTARLQNSQSQKCCQRCYSSIAFHCASAEGAFDHADAGCEFSSSIPGEMFLVV